MSLKPAALKKGSRIAVLSPSSAARADRVTAGMAVMRELGYEPVLMPHALDRGPLYYAGRAEDRVADLHAAFADRTIDGILCTRGGWGSAELLPLLDADLVRSNPKFFCGFSDQTTLHSWLQNVADLVTFYGPMVSPDFGRAGEQGVEPTSWWNATNAQTWSVDRQNGLQTISSGEAEGVLRGGCLSILTEALGTPYALKPFTEPTVLFLEDVGVKPYQWDRMLLHLRYAGGFENVSGVVFGDMKQSCLPEEQELLGQALRHVLQWFSGPIAIGLQSGHVDEANITLPLGVRVRLELSTTGNPQMHFLEAAFAE